MFNQLAGVPAYFPPGPDWDRMVEARPHVAMVILNLADGPGDERAPKVADQVALLRGVGVMILGYIDTANATRSVSAIMADARRYEEWYRTQAVFLDQAQVPEGLVDSYYRPLYQRLKQGSASRCVVVNAGQAMPEQVMAAADIVVDFEGDYHAYIGWSQPGWTARYPPGRFWHIVHGVAGADHLDRVFRLSRARRAGWLYATDQAAGGAPSDGYLYDRLPGLDHWQRFQHGLGTSG
jgi:Spherulation-specific family 4